MSWSPQQDTAIKAVRAWLADRNGPQVFRLFGYAGTGKTTLAKELAESVKGSVLFATFTGKAALMLQSKGCKGASTIHSLIYSVEVDEDTGEAEFTLNQASDLASAALLVVDEVSMVGEELARNLPSEAILRGNMRGNGYDRIWTSTTGWKWTQPLDDGDVVLTPPTGEE